MKINCTIVTLILINLGLNIYCQQINDYTNNLLNLFVHENAFTYKVVEYERRRKPSQYLIFKDSLPIDTLNYSFKTLFYSDDQYIIIDTKDGIKRYSFTDKTSIKIGEILDDERIVGVKYPNIYIYGEHFNAGDLWRDIKIKITALNMISGKREIIFNKNIDQVYEDEWSTMASSYLIPSGNEVLLISMIDPGEGGYMGPTKGFIIDLIDGKVAKTNFEYITEKGAWHEYIIDFNNDLFFLDYSESNRMGETLKKKQLIVSEDMKVVSEYLYRSFDDFGQGIDKDGGDLMIYKSVDDNGNPKLITENLSGIRDICFYKIYNNILIERNDIETLSNSSLWLIKNFIFAKYNYSFEDLYLQTFYNQYEFYRNQSGSRKTRVEHKFNDTDKANLKLIEEVINEKGGR